MSTCRVESLELVPSVLEVVAAESASETRVVAVAEAGRVQIALSHKYMGSVKYYDGWWSRKINSVVGRSRNVQIGDETFCVNKRSYEKHVKTLLGEEARVERVYQETMKCFPSDPAFAEMNDRLWKHLSDLKQQRLLMLFLEALSKQEFLYAKEILGRGVPLSEHYVLKHWSDHEYVCTSHDKMQWLCILLARPWFEQFNYTGETALVSAASAKCEPDKEAARLELVDLLKEYGSGVKEGEYSIIIETMPGSMWI
jgi:hypothetical protein